MDLWLKFKWVWVILGMIFVSVVISFIFLLINKCISRKGKHRFSQFQRPLDFKTESNKYQERNPEADIPALPPRTQFLTAEAQSYENLAEVPDYEQDIHNYEQSTDQQPGYNDPDHNMKSGVSMGQSYENLAEEPDYEQSTADYEQDIHDYEQNIHDYEQSTDQQPGYNDPDHNMKSDVSMGQSYENLAEEPDYEQSTANYEQDIHDYEEDIHDYEQNIHDYEQSTDQQPGYNDPDQNMKSDVSMGQSYENLAEEPDYEQSLDEQPDYVKVDVEVLSPYPAGPAADNSSMEDYDDIGGDTQDEEDYDDVG